MMRYRKKPVVVEAMEWTGENREEIEGFLNGSYMFWDGILYIVTLEGDMQANVGDIIIKGVQGEFYPCKPDIFALTYEEV